ncbi:Verru/Chthon cassette protein A [Verrucomicrobia bacterium LW23]|nr:Verru/Chthon cassette protein A [Verrucomicrobia bacterium LW23]
MSFLRSILGSFLSSPLLRPLAGRRGRRGVTLVVVLGMLALMAVLMISYLTSASTELAAAKRYSSGLDARSLTDSAVNIVKAQIQDATSQPSLAWASQPGMVRTYDSSGEQVMAYKLYSSEQLRVTGAFNPVASAGSEVPANWSTRKNLFTDLNRPVTVGGVKHYPIIYPSAVASGPSSTTAMDGGSQPIEGCYLDTGNGAVATTSTQTNPVPLPVKWMYVLKNGTVAAMDPATGKVAGAGAMLPDGTPNIITGRIAFWTDDESSKVNVNTASIGTYWERPVTASPGDLSGMSDKMPVQNEFQRYPGHPAMTSLGVVFPQKAAETRLDYLNRIYNMVPRVVPGGSNGGETVTAVKNNSALWIAPDGQRLYASVDDFLFQGKSPAQTGTGARKPHDDVTQSDMEKARFFITTSSRAPEVNMWNKPRVTLWPLQAHTADVSTPTASTERNAMDKLIAFCSTIGNTPYYFQRYNVYSAATPAVKPSSQSPTMDWTEIPRNQQIYAYLQKLTSSPIPGLGGRLAGPVGAKYPERVRDQTLTQMWDYLRSTINTYATYSTPNYFYTPFHKSSFIAAQGQVVPLSLPNGTRGFGRFSTVQQVALTVFRKDKRTMQSATIPKQVIPGDPPYTLDGDVRTGPNALSFPAPDPGDPIELGAVFILQPFSVTPGSPPWTQNMRVVIEGARGLTFNDQYIFKDRMVNNISAINSTINSTPFAGMEEWMQKPARAPKVLGETSEINPESEYYPFFANVTLPAPAISGVTTLSLGAADIVVKVYAGTTGPLNNADLIQTITFRFPAMSNLPMPTATTPTMTYNATTGKTSVSHQNHYTSFNERLNVNQYPGRYGYAEDNKHNPLPLFIVNGVSTANPTGAGDTVRSVELRYGGPAKGDVRLIAGLKDVPLEYFEAHGQKDVPSSDGKLFSDTDPKTSRAIHSVRIHYPGSGDTSNQNGFYAGTGVSGDKRGKLVKNAAYRDPNRGNNSRDARMPFAPRGMTEALMSDGVTLGDWDNGPGNQPDGPFINKGDEGTANVSQSGSGAYYETGGYVNGAGVVESGASFSPARQLASAVTFGSLPSYIDQNDSATTLAPASKPWQTLLFCRNPLGGDSHPGFGSPISGPPYDIPPDHAFLDLFTMPVVEPYAISEPFSTAGKVNMNYQIVPFTYLTRSTGMRAVLKPVEMMAIPFAEADRYKDSNKSPSDYRYLLNLSETTGTLKGFENRFSSGDIFRSASEICSIYLVPGTSAPTNVGTAAPIPLATYDNMNDWWKGYTMTGDNTRESPYNSIYPRVTTKSNTFTVHVMTQALKKSRNTPVDEWVEGTDTVSGEFRGSVLMERYLDPSSDNLVQADGRTPAGELDDNAMVGPYKWREINVKQFAP